MIRFLSAHLAVGIATARLSAKPDRSIFPEAERIVVVGDIHGDYEQLILVLQSAEIINHRRKWIAKKTHLVQLGDIPDRADSTLKIIEFLRDLEKQARRKRGRVHILIGNHDAMNVYGDLRYVVDGEFAAFATEKSAERLELLYENEIAWIKENNPEEKWPIFDDAFREQWFESRPLGYLEHRINWLPTGDIGAWTIDRNAILKIGRNLFIHGGLGPEYANWSIDEINAAVRESLADVDNIEETILKSEEGPLWYRGLAQNPQETERAHLETLLEHFNVDRIILGHTPTNGVIWPRFNGKVILVDVGLSRYYGDHLASLIIEGDELTAIHRKGSVRLPSDTGNDSMIDYLKNVAKREPNSMIIEKRLAKLESAFEKIANPIESD